MTDGTIPGTADSATDSGAAPGFRSQRWFGAGGMEGFLQRSAMRVQGFDEGTFEGRPVIGICNNWSELTRCHLHFREMAEAVKRGIWQAGGFPREFPSMSLGADLMETPFMHRNLLAMEVEQTIRTNPLDAVVLMAACDDTIPAMLMAVASLDIPALVLPGGPALNGRWRGEDVGSSTDCHRYYSEYRAGRMSAADWRTLESHVEHSAGHCSTMGTASTMACIAEGLGMALPGSAAIPAVDSRRTRMAQTAGRCAVDLARAGLRPSAILTAKAFDNAVRVFAAVAGSTNAVVHLQAIAGRLGYSVPLNRLDELMATTPVLANVKPCGHYLMEDFFEAGGVPTLMKALGSLIHKDPRTVTGQAVESNLESATVLSSDIIRSIGDPAVPGPSLVVLRGNLAPEGAVLKAAAASRHLLRHEGPAVVFESYPDFLRRVDDPDLIVGSDSVIVIRGMGPRGSSRSGVDCLGTLTLPEKLLRQGIRDMVRVTDGRMSGTAYGTVILHASPEAAAGGPLAVVKDGDVISLDVPERRIDVRVSDREWARRMSQVSPPPLETGRGYTRLYLEHVEPFGKGADFDFLTGTAETPLPTSTSRHPSVEA